MIDLLKSPRQILMDETGLPQLDSSLLNNTQPYGVQGHATGGAISEKSPEDMIAEMIYGGRTPSKFQYASGGIIKELMPFVERMANKAKFLEPSVEKNVMYHGTSNAPTNSQGITAFNPSAGVSVNPAADKVTRRMTFLSPSSEFAGYYTGNLEKGNPTIYPVHVQATNPFDYNNPEHVQRLANKVINPTGGEITGNQYRQINDLQDSLSRGKWEAIEKPEVQQAAQDLGHDSMYMQENGIRNLGVFDPGKIKSAIGNEGTYDVTNPDIRKADGGIINKALPHIGHAFAIEPAIDTAKALMNQHWGHTLEGISDLAQAYSPMKASVLSQLATYSPELNSNESAELAKRQAMPALSVLNNPQNQ